MLKLLAPLVLVLVVAGSVASPPGIATASPASTVAATPKPAADKPKPKRTGDARRSAAVKDGDAAARERPEDVSTPNRGTIDPIGALTRGQAVEIRATTLASGQACALRLFYADKAAPVIRDVTPDKDKRCVFSVTIPERAGVVGEAKAMLIFTKATSGKKVGTARQAFTVS